MDPPALPLYRRGPVPGSWVYLGTDPIPLSLLLARQLRISNAPKKSAPQTFHSFKILATEIRSQIWAYLLPDARVVEFEPVEKKRGKFVVGCYSLYPKLASKFNQKSLGVLPYVCRDSRAFFLDNYHLSFDSFLRNPIYFNPKNDIVLFSNEHALELFSDALNRIPWAEARASVAPVRKAAIRWTLSDESHKRNLAEEYNLVATVYKLKLRVLLERLTTLEKFAFLYLFRSIGEDPKARMVQFVKGLETQMSERKEVAKKEGKKGTNIPLTPWADHVPELVMLQCPTRMALQNDTSRHGSDDHWGQWGKESWELGTREWDCSRFNADYVSDTSSEDDDDDEFNPHANRMYDAYHQFQHDLYHQQNERW